MLIVIYFIFGMTENQFSEYHCIKLQYYYYNYRKIPENLYRIIRIYYREYFGSRDLFFYIFQVHLYHYLIKYNLFNNIFVYMKICTEEIEL